VLNLEEVIRVTTDVFSRSDEMKIHLESHVEGSPLIRADKDQVIRVFNNLITNAIQAIPGDIEGLINVVIKSQNGKFITEVRDNGSGIDPSEQDRIFVPNFTTKSTGMGMGLAMVKNIVENSGGEVWFKSRPGKGSSFFVAFPKIDIGQKS
jgi:signal transduction histidine kinase